ncbi:glycoside hydrolase family 19 protein [Starkeya sp. ORNL1]|uniref:glycoside hydrolase family 19 protein n=1 Tax=Starkeya sp. ORNL1 TaxID=2709380 RepID=UPI0014649657|nr:peptidoglycan-binding protein [Starkeya sp. ORNL1]QJP14609.1 glycoside hydrolase family 19 protein [Starkeya sp. ORNL1]
MRTVMKLALVATMVYSAAGLAEAQGTKKSEKAVGPPSVVAAPFTDEMLKQFSPRSKPEIRAAIIAQWSRAAAAGIDTPNEIHHFLAQLATESGGFRYMEENLNYSPKRLRQIFPKYFKTEAEAEAAAAKPQLIANRVYGNRLGNECPTDGWDFRGSGLIQLTGRDNFRDRGRALGLKPTIEDYPELARTQPVAFYAAVSYWSSRNINVPAARDDLIEVRRRVNGGKIGLNEARIWLAQARRFVRLPGDKSAQDKSADKGLDDPTSPGRIAGEDQLVALGFLPAQDKPDKSTKSSQDKAATVSDSLRRFQESRDIEQTGQFDEATLYELTDTGNFLEQIVERSKEKKAAKGALPAFCRKESSSQS